MSNCFCGQKSKGLECGLCQTPVCKGCAHFLDEGQFSFMTKIPAELSHSCYCTQCFDQKVSAPLESYLSLIEKAKDIQVFEKTQGKESRLIRRIADPVHVEACDDRAETLLRLAFFAAQGGYNALVDVDIRSKKVVRDNAYQKTLYSGVGIPANLQAHQIVKDRSIWQNPN